MGALDGAAIVVSNVIGGGIFIVPAVVAQLAPSPAAMLGVWLVGGALALAGALAYAELAALRPQAGGEYVYLREAYGPLLGFLAGWTSFVAGFSGAIAASAVGMAGIMGRFVPAAADTTPIFSVPLGFVSLTLSPQSAVALAAIVGMSVVHSLGLGPGRVVNNLLAGAKVAVLVVVIALGFSLGRGSATHYAEGGPIALASWTFALIPVLFSYAGWNAAAYVSEEIRNPEKNVPKALLMGTGIVVVIYLALNMVYVYAMPLAEFPDQALRIGDVAVERLFGPGAAGAWAAASIVMIAAAISAMVLAGPRVYYAMARDGLFFPAAGRVHPRFRTPVVAIAAQAVWSSVLVLTGTFDQLVEYTGFGVVLFAGIAVFAVFVLRRRRPLEHRPFRAWGYPLAPLFFVVASLLIVVNALRESPATSGAGLLIIGLGVPFYFLWRWRN
ncbi:MAG: amino acid permease [Acidobacteriota bacterium]|nr:amino acid permease [Acidobacteriota bacterium]MDE3263739.1 amino acid permease [Acidobacteriota bacterium]